MHDFNREAVLAHERAREAASRFGAGYDAAGRPVFSGAGAMYASPREGALMQGQIHQAWTDSMNAQARADRANYESDSAKAEILAERQRGIEDAQRQQDATYREREMALRERDSAAQNKTAQTMASGINGAMSSMANVASGLSQAPSTGGVSMTMLGANGQRIGGGSVSPLRRLIT